MNPTPQDLIARWREQANVERLAIKMSVCAPTRIKVLEECAAQLEDCLNEFKEEQHQKFWGAYEEATRLNTLFVQIVRPFARQVRTLEIKLRNANHMLDLADTAHKETEIL